ncbi:hypothetical protein [Streptococcus pneumoniae]|uniref:hypothetical protein n=1 Tax=Streptococcus pneumoniae TaxID=1313 RepID=UPI0003A09A5F|nr:hypothetical protein [Streptococcus pneumoniae]
MKNNTLQTIFENLFKPRQLRLVKPRQLCLTVCMVSSVLSTTSKLVLSFVSSIYNLKAVL